MFRRHRLAEQWPLLAFVALSVVFAGCSSERPASPLSPGAQTPDSRLGVLLVQPSGAVQSTGQVIDGAVGGTSGAGRYTLTIPPGAFQGTQTITLQPACGSNLEVVCKPEGLQFSIPATLEMNVAGSTVDASDATILWYDPANATWVDMHGMYQSGKHSVTALIPHFSTYSGGRGGW